ncbi:T9SS type A sorting domain-containing protein [Aquimarina sp. TRL1]|uniref:T9SS type A sorting domain-containing protein n=1 Tax=Aquimarina sp. (strain TRL1) TaxID=2736252 RepID=UPI00158E7B74|nr:T9SS type A sorting domain-containing protein [Aquimarina sp. TRL1]QKX05438.1 T9SS type A sorting domain-containing protein [Aquimarina sp. TRL1]
MTTGLTGVAQQTQTRSSTNTFSGFQGQVSLKDSQTSPRDNPRARWEYHMEKIVDPSTKKLPEDIRKKEIAFVKGILEGKELSKSVAKQQKSGKHNYYYWKQRGPANVGGRTRALAVDRTNENVILAGGVTGGLWRSEDAGNSWRQISGFYDNPAITSIVQDPRPGKEHIWYYGGGERYGSTGDGISFEAGGIYKSVNGGRSFSVLSSSVVPMTKKAKKEFAFVNSLAVDATTGNLYVASTEGVYRWEENTFETIRTIDPVNQRFGSGYNIAVSPTGQVYAAYNGDSSFYQNPDQPFFFSSTDQGNTWKDISPPLEMTKNFNGRAIIEIDPSDENRIYLFVTTMREDYNSANVYRYQVTDREPWTDLSQNLLMNQGFVNSLTTQGGYNMVFEVHPTNPNIIFVGGANLFRSETGLTTPLEIKDRVGGYCSDTGMEYHHADQHALWFYESDPNKMLSANDGGVHLTNNLMGKGCEGMKWKSLSNGYYTTQPYHVSFDPNSKKEELLAGFQDNGSWYSDSRRSDHPWDFIHGADGGYSAIADHGKTMYVSTQGGYVIRYKKDNNGTVIDSGTVVSPKEANLHGFIVPFMLDPINDNIMYYLGRKTVWRNNNLDSIPATGNQEHITINWEGLELGVSGTPSAIGLSRYPVGNRMYIGTKTGTIYRLDNANVANGPAKDISSGKGLPQGYINHINVDPSNSDRAIVTYSNYGIPSLFITEDGGETWTDIGGNLEEQSDGKGNGPSAKASAFLGGSNSALGVNFQTVFVATSTGLYYTRHLKGKNTYWYKEPFVVGNALTTTVQTRKDGFIAISSHGNGMFSAKFPVFFNPIPEPTIHVAQMLDNIEVDYRDNYTTSIDVSNVFETDDGNPPSISLINSNPALVTAALNGDLLTLNYKGNTNVGSATITLIAKKGEEQTSEGFSFISKEPMLYDQKQRGTVNSFLTSYTNDQGYASQGADDFTIPAGEIWNIRRIIAFTHSSEYIPFAVEDISSLKIQLYNDQNGKPGTLREEYSVDKLDFLDKDISIVLPSILQLEEGTYWISIIPHLKNEKSQWIWGTYDIYSSDIKGAPAHYLGKNFFSDQPDITTWTPVHEIEKYAPYIEKCDARFQLFGVKEGETSKRPEETTELPLLLWPNPSHDFCQIDFKTIRKFDKKVTIDVFDALGNNIKKINQIRTQIGQYFLNIQSLPKGTYIVKITGKKTNKTFKILKK